MATAAEVTSPPPPPSCVQPEVTLVERDIDGVPLRDHKKIDLKSILGHAPEVDDDDDESEATTTTTQPEVEIELRSAAPTPQLETTASDLDEEEGDDGGAGDCMNCPLQRQRRSSLRTTQHHHDPPDSPTGDRKAVRFADSLGIGLEAIRDVGDSEEPPEIPHSAMTALRLRRKRSLNSRLVLVPTYSHPPVEDTVSPGRGVVHLESSFVSSRELTVSGVVRVTHDTSNEKTVTVRYTTDAWVTSRDVPANYVPNSNDGATDRFVFIVHLPDGFGDEEKEDGFLPDRQGRVEFAVGLHVVGGVTFWDDNDGGNYVIDCVMRSRESSISGEAKTPDEVEGLTLGGDVQ